MTTAQKKVLRCLRQYWSKAPVGTKSVTIISLHDKGYIKMRLPDRLHWNYYDCWLQITPAGKKALAEAV